MVYQRCHRWLKITIYGPVQNHKCTWNTMRLFFFFFAFFCIFSFLGNLIACFLVTNVKDNIVFLFQKAIWAKWFFIISQVYKVWGLYWDLGMSLRHPFLEGWFATLTKTAASVLNWVTTPAHTSCVTHGKQLYVTSLLVWRGSGHHRSLQGKLMSRKSSDYPLAQSKSFPMSPLQTHPGQWVLSQRLNPVQTSRNSERSTHKVSPASFPDMFIHVLFFFSVLFSCGKHVQ